MICFKVNCFLCDFLTGRTRVKYKFSIAKEEKTINTTFNDAYSARVYLTASARDWLLGCLDDYVNHKKHIIEAGNHFNQVKPLRFCNEALMQFHLGQQSIHTIAERFLKGFVWFETILPAEQNPSYKSSVEKLNALKSFCELVQSKKLPFVV